FPVDIQVSSEQREEIMDNFPIPNLTVRNDDFTIETEVHGNKIEEVPLLLIDYSIEKTQGTTPRPYFKIKFSNHLGTYSSKMWDNDGAIDRYSPLLEAYSVFKVSGRVDEYKGFKSITLSNLIPCENNEIDPY